MNRPLSRGLTRASCLKRGGGRREDLGNGEPYGDAGTAVNLLARATYLAEKLGGKLTLDLVDQRAAELDCDSFLLMVRTAPVQRQAVMAANMVTSSKARPRRAGAGEAYEAYRRFFERSSLRPLSARAFTDLVAELDVYAQLRSRVLSRGRHGRTREFILDPPDEPVARIRDTVEENLGTSGSTGQTQH